MKAAPGFVAERSIYRTSRAYIGHPRQQRQGDVISALIDPGCFDACYNHCNWGCFELVGSARGACLRECKEIEISCRRACTVSSCIPSTTCYQDPSTTDSRCQICYRDNCDGTGSVWHTC
jgi:hypothetical protein